jgi:hypothetical protein
MMKLNQQITAQQEMFTTQKELHRSGWNILYFLLVLARHLICGAGTTNYLFFNLKRLFNA